MGTLRSAVRVNVTKQTKSRQRRGFNVICVTGPNLISGRYAVVTDIDQVAALLTNGSSDPEYTAVNTIFSQSPRPDKVVIGKYISGTDADYAEALTNIALEYPAFYGVIITSRVAADQVSTASWVLSNDRIASFASADTEIVDNPSEITSIAYTLKSTTNDRAQALYHTKAATEFLDAAAMIIAIVEQAGTYTQCWMVPKGVTVDELTPTQQTTAHDKYCNTFEEIGSDNVILYGWVGSGDYFDSTHFADYNASRLSEDIFALFVGGKKVSFDDPGITKIEGKMVKVFDPQAAEQDGGNGALTPQSIDEQTKEINGGYKIVMPAAKDISVGDKATRILGGVNSPEATLWYSGAIHEVEINLIVTL